MIQTVSSRWFVIIMIKDTIGVCWCVCVWFPPCATDMMLFPPSMGHSLPPVHNPEGDY